MNTRIQKIISDLRPTDSHIILDAQTVFDYTSSFGLLTPFDVRSLPCVRPPFEEMIICGNDRGKAIVFQIGHPKDKIDFTVAANILINGEARLVARAIFRMDQAGAVVDTQSDWLNNGQLIYEWPHQYSPISLMIPMLEALAFMHVKGAKRESVGAGKFQSTKRIMGIGRPLYSYKTLVIEPLENMMRHAREAGGKDFRAHIVRGHFKDYRENGLGKNKMKGVFWWPAHVRGNKSIGIVAKEYKTGDVPS